MAAANENQGLKIAVAVLVSLTVLLAVSTFMMYNQYSQAEAKRVEADKKAGDERSAASKALGDYQNLKEWSGFKGVEDPEILKQQIGKFQEKVTKDVDDTNSKIKKMVADYAQAGGQDARIKEISDAADHIAATYRDEPNKTLNSTVERLRELFDNQARLTTAFALDNLSLRRDLEGINSVTAEKINQHSEALNKSKADLEAEHADHEKRRTELLAKVDKLQTDLDNTRTENESLKTKLKQSTEDFQKKLGDMSSQLAYLKDLQMRKETIMDQPDGVITSIDYYRNEVKTNITRRMGARPRMQFAIFDSRGPIPNKHPKANIELISVDNSGSLARIMPAVRAGQNLQGTADIEEPIHQGDYIYSPAWSPNTPERFALIGKMDMNRDGKDDRADLKRLIEASGGIIEYDLPPPGAGRESGQLSSLCKFYVVDERPPLTIQARNRTGPSEEEKEFFKKQTEAMREARSLGVHPIAIEDLLTYLGYNPNIARYGRVEGLDKQASDQLLYPRGRVPAGAAGAGGAATTPPAAPETAGEAKKNETPKNESETPKDEKEAPKDKQDSTEAPK